MRRPAIAIPSEPVASGAAQTTLTAAEQAAQLALLIENVSDYAIFLLDTGGHVRTWNRGAERIKGYTAAEAVGRHLSVFSTDEDRARHHSDHLLQVARRDGRVEEEAWRVRKDGSRFWASVVLTALYDETGEVIGFGKVTRDLTRRRLDEEHLRATATELRATNLELEQFRRLVLGVRDYAIFLLEPGGQVASWNAGAEQLKGYEAEEIIGRHFSVFYTQEDRDRNHPGHELEIAAADGRYEEEGWRVRKDGSRFWANVTITSLHDDAGDLVGFAKITRDLTVRREAEEAQRLATEELGRVNEELDRFASVAAHDLNDPLRTVSGFAELLAHEELSPTAREYVEHIRAISERMSRLLTGLLDFARSGQTPDDAQSVAVEPAVRRVVEGLRSSIVERAAEIVVDVPAEAEVCAAPGDVELILQNLIANGLKFGAPETPTVRIGASREGDGWRVTVGDDGVGIAPEDRGRIFAPFERAHAKLSRGGTGLGLAICERLVQRHGGSIGVESEPGQGSTFWVLLPAPDPAA